MGRKVNVFMFDILVGTLEEKANKYVFAYDSDYKGKPISLSIPNSTPIHESKDLHPYFMSLVPEGWLKKRYSEIQRIDERDSFGFLIENGADLIGAISIESIIT
ncbi:HipA N-terminal domain-containing protein [Psychromonas sp. 14N.309.X.WAT.B.A12]|uniref:HipA N-terminal domain-containing protein n=1 Tax=Psychromonas sp. 14N.309.X.WAT.B.A12 TaxID=2998322 RepID=UPI0025B133F8|nr:HipA N-terminal domain-containing protein [Psychromonas sp. 14N.309.X.WAT.B.A12]MDN2662646.1 HipA N-terminal domain-containing protein [Psychromonas sp. 14N.309.X.WAT.B.A12]